MTGQAPDDRVVLTLDAGGTTLVFSAMRGGEEAAAPVVLPAAVATLGEFLLTVLEGFRSVAGQLERGGLPAPSALSFAFPGPADYEHGVIGDLENLPEFRGGVALGPMLEDEFGVPVVIANDGDLFALGEAVGGLLPEVDRLLAAAGSSRRCRHLLGVTLGTGFGSGIVVDGRLLRGDNSAGGEINRLRDRLHPEWSVEETVSARGLRRAYAVAAGLAAKDAPSPLEIFEIGMGRRAGPAAAARAAFEELAVVAGDALASAASLVDGLVVLGGGISGAHPLFLPRLVAEMNAAFVTAAGGGVSRMETLALDLEDPAQAERFVVAGVREVAVPFSSRTVPYHEDKVVGVGLSRLGTARAVALGAYRLALQRLDEGG